MSISYRREEPSANGKPGSKRWVITVWDEDGNAVPRSSWAKILGEDEAAALEREERWETEQGEEADQS